MEKRLEVFDLLVDALTGIVRAMGELSLESGGPEALCLEALEEALDEYAAEVHDA